MEVKKMQTPRERTMALLEEIAVSHYVTLDDVLGESKSKVILPARFHCYRALREQGMSLKKIGRIMGRDHTTVLKGLRRVGSR